MQIVRLMPVVLAGMVMAAPASAQDAGNREAALGDPAPVMLTPFVSLGSSTSSRIGGAVSFLVAPRTSIEGEVGYRDNAVDASVGLVYDLPRLGRITPYLAGGVGLQEYSTLESSSNTGVLFARHTGLTVNAGGGLRVPIDRNWGVRSDARWFNGIGGQAPERWRLYNGVTLGRGRPSP